ncbi:hypothetical protein [Sphingomonas sp. 28-63-12]|uniref:hypothetical protein n=1 Tax=Sphingomonas sp. 28-63-12 TaxID=1970434 RepID=UPI0035A94729
MALPVRLLVLLQLLLCATIAFSPLIVALAVKPDLSTATIIDVLAERVSTALVVSIGLIGVGLLGWARYGPTTFICVMIFFCPTFAALYLAALGFR